MHRSRGTSLPILGLLLLFAAGCADRQAMEQEPAAPEPAVVAATEPVESRPPAITDLLPNALEPLPGVVVGGQPSAEQLALARDLGYRTVISLRRPEEDATSAEHVEALDMTYVSLPIGGADSLTVENAQAFALALEEAERPAIIHCASGNRVGALFALKAFHVDGATAEEALQLGLDAGMTRLEAPVREHLGLVVGAEAASAVAEHQAADDG